MCITFAGCRLRQLSPTFWRVGQRYGWRETPNVEEEVFHRCGLEGLSCPDDGNVVLLCRTSLLIVGGVVFAFAWQAVFVAATQRPARDQFKIA